MNVFTVNAFTANGNGGNPAGVVLGADNLTNVQMLATARQLGFSETAFVLKSDKATFRVRFFTVTEEVELCGHATIATWSLMFQQGLVGAGSYSQETLAGVLGIEISEDGKVFMEQAAAQFHEVVDLSKTAAVLGVKDSDLNETFPPQIVSTGLRDILVCAKDRRVLASLKPDFPAMTRLSEELDVIGVHVFTLGEGEATAYARNFAPKVGIDEESATGTSNGALLSYLQYKNALPKKEIYQIVQGEAMQETSYIFGKFKNGKIWIGGHASQS